MTIASRGLRDAVACLRGQHQDLLSQILDSGFCLWLGSGVSRERFMPLGALLEHLLDQLHQRIRPSDPGCPYLSALRTILHDIGSATDVDPGAHIGTWEASTRLRIIKDLIGKYSDVFGVHIEDPGGSLEIWWDVLKLQEIYAEKKDGPDAEHRLTALLVEEGVFKELFTTNWDTLIEDAALEVRNGRSPILGVYVQPERMAASPGERARLRKVHGCARSAVNDPTVFKDLFIVTKSHIQKWKEFQRWDPFRDELRVSLRKNPSLLVGISAQDWNLQLEILQAYMTQENSASVRLVFSGESLTHHQKVVLRGAHAAAVYQANAAKIDAQSLVQLYGKPLLGAIYVINLVEKLKLLLAKGQEDLRPFFTFTEVWVSYLEEWLFLRADQAGQAEGYRNLAFEVSAELARNFGIWRDQKVPQSRREYTAFYDRNTADLRCDDNVVGLGYHWTLLVIALLLEVEKRGHWIVGAPGGNDAEFGHLTLSANDKKVTVFILGRSLGMSALEAHGVNLEGSPIVVIYPLGLSAKSRKDAPTRQFAGSASPYAAHEVWFQESISGSTSVDEVLVTLRAEMASGGLV